MRPTMRACALLVLCVVCCSVGTASAATEPSVAVRPDEGLGRRKVLARDLLQAPPQASHPCMHSQTASSTSTSQPKQPMPAVKGAAAAATPLRQLLQAARPRPAPAINPKQRQGFTTARRPGVNAAQVAPAAPAAARPRPRPTAG